MSICRFSDLNYGCDLYLYEGDGGWTLHVAGLRYPEGVPKLLPYPVGEEEKSAKWDVWYSAYRKQREWLRDFIDHLAPISLPYAGQSFGFHYPEDCIKFCKELRELGYRFPDHVLDRESY